MSVRLVIMDPIDSTENGSGIFIEIGFLFLRMILISSYDIDYSIWRRGK